MNKIFAAIQDIFFTQRAIWKADREIREWNAKEVLLRGLQSERTSPQAALKLFKSARRENTASFPDLQLIAFVLPLVATLASYFAIRRLQLEESAWSYVVWFAIQFLLAYFPIILVYLKKVKGTRQRYSNAKESDTSMLVGTVLFMLNDVLAVVGIVLFGICITLPIVLPTLWILNNTSLGLIVPGQYVNVALIVLIVLVGSSFYLTNQPFPIYFFPSGDYFDLSRAGKIQWWKCSMYSMLRQILAGWSFNFNLISQTILSLAYYFWTVKMADLISQIPLAECVFSGLLAGVLVGNTFKRLDDNPLTEQLALLGEVRCLIRLRKLYAAQERIWWVQDVSTVNLIKALANSLEYYKSYKAACWPETIKIRSLQSSQDLIKVVAEKKWEYSDRHHVNDLLWSNSLSNSRALIEESLSSEDITP